MGLAVAPRMAERDGDQPAARPDRASAAGPNPESDPAATDGVGFG